VRLIFHENGTQVRLTEDQRPVEYFAAQRADEALADRVHPVGLDYSIAAARAGVSWRFCRLASSVRDLPRRLPAHRARTGSVNVQSGAPFGYRYVRKTDLAGAAYEIAGHEAVLVAEMFRRYADDGAAIADLGRWLTGQGAVTRTGKQRWDRSVIWGRAVHSRLLGLRIRLLPYLGPDHQQEDLLLPVPGQR